MDAFLAKLREKERAPATIESAEDRLTLILGLPANGQRMVRWVDKRGAELYAAAQLFEDGTRRANDTHHNALNLGRQWAKFCVSKRWLHSNPFAGVEPVGQKVHGSEKEQLSLDESRRLRAYCHMHRDDQGAVLTLAYLLLGTRASELVKRDVRDLDDDGNQLRVGKTKTKAGRRRMVLPDELRELLVALAKDKQPDAPLFTNTSGKRATRWVAYNHVKRICKLAKVPELCPQALRRTQSSLATDAGVAALAVSAHLGHASTGITARAYVDPDVARNAGVERGLRAIAGGKR